MLDFVLILTTQQSLANSTSHMENTSSKGTPPAECESQSTASVQSSIGRNTVSRHAANGSEDPGDISRGQSIYPIWDAEPEHNHDGGVGDSTTETDQHDTTTVAPESRHPADEENNPDIARMEANLDFTSEFPMATRTAASWRSTPAEISEKAEKPANTSAEEHNANSLTLEVREATLTLAWRAMAAMNHRHLAPGTEALRADDPAVHRITTPDQNPSSVGPTARPTVFDPVRSSSAQSQSPHMPEDHMLKDYFRQPTVPEVEDNEVRTAQSPITIPDGSPIRASATRQLPPVSFESSFPATQTFGVATHPAGRPTPTRHQFIVPAPAQRELLERATPAPCGRPFSQIPRRHGHRSSGFVSHQSRLPPVPQGFGPMREMFDGDHVGEHCALLPHSRPSLRRPVSRCAPALHRNPAWSRP